MNVVANALTQYGATLGIGGQICRNDKSTGVMVRIARNRIRFESSSNGRLLASGPVSKSTVEKFVESFWFWSKL